MTKQKHAAALVGLLFAGGTILTASPAIASVSAGQSLTTVPSTATAAVSGVPEHLRCHWVRGHWSYRHGHRVWIHRHRVCR